MYRKMHIASVISWWILTNASSRVVTMPVKIQGIWPAQEVPACHLAIRSPSPLHAITFLIFKNIDIKFLYYKIQHLEVYRLVVVSTFTRFCSHHHYLIPEHLNQPRKKSYIHEAVTPIFPFPPGPGYHFLILRHSFLFLNFRTL